MLGVGDRVENPRTGAILEIVCLRGDGAGVLELRRMLKSGTGKTIAHAHRDEAERFVVQAGEALLRVAGVEHRLAAGDELEIQIAQRHANAHNTSTEDLVPRQFCSRLAISGSPMWRRWAT